MIRMRATVYAYNVSVNSLIFNSPLVIHPSSIPYCSLNVAEVEEMQVGYVSNWVYGDVCVCVDAVGGVWCFAWSSSIPPYHPSLSLVAPVYYVKQCLTRPKMCRFSLFRRSFCRVPKVNFCLFYFLHLLLAIICPSITLLVTRERNFCLSSFATSSAAVATSPLPVLEGYAAHGVLRRVHLPAFRRFILHFYLPTLTLSTLLALGRDCSTVISDPYPQ